MGIKLQQERFWEVSGEDKLSVSMGKPWFVLLLETAHVQFSQGSG